MITISAIKADVGSIGGHTRPSDGMLAVAREKLQTAVHEGTIKDFEVTHIGDDLSLLMTHLHGTQNETIHNLAWSVFLAANDVALEEGLSGVGQDLFKEKPNGNIHGAGPGVAEIAFDPGAEERREESFLLFTADKCGPGAFNFPLWASFTCPLYNSGLMLPKMKVGFTFVIIDMEHAGADRVIELNAPEQHLDLAVLLRDEGRFGIKAIYTRAFPEQQVVSLSAERVHSFVGEYKGKDDPVALIRTQGIFPAPEEVVSPYHLAPYIAGAARGSHHMPLMPVPINTAVTGGSCTPLIACMAYSVTRNGKLSQGVDIFDNPAWDGTRRKAQRKAEEMRQQGFVGPAMLPMNELEYSAFRETLQKLEGQFKVWR